MTAFAADLITDMFDTAPILELGITGMLGISAKRGHDVFKIELQRKLI